MTGSPRQFSYALLWTFTLLGLLLRTYGIQASLWMDELHTAWVVAGGLNELPGRAALGNNHSSYFYLPWVSTNVFGTHEWSLRLTSVIAGTVLIPLMFLATRRWTQSRLAALLSAGLVAIDPWCVVFAQEARVYALVQCIGLLQLLTLWNVVKRPQLAHRVALIALSTLLFYLHFTSILLLLAELLFCLAMYCRSSRRNGYSVSQLLCDAALVFVGMLPAWPQLVDIASRRSNWELFVHVPTAAQFIYLFPLDLYVLAPILCAGIAVVGRALAKDTVAGRRIRPAVWLLVSVWFFVPMATAAMLTWTDVARIFHARYLITVSLAPILFASLLCAICARPVRMAFTVVMMLIALFSHGPIRQILRDGDVICHRRENWRDALRWIREHAREGAPLLFHSGLIEADDLARQADPRFVEYCKFPLSSIYRIDDLSLQVFLLPTSDAEHFLESGLASAADAGMALLVVRGPEQITQRLIRAAHLRLGDSGNWSLEEQHFAGVSVARLVDRQHYPRTTRAAQIQQPASWHH